MTWSSVACPRSSIRHGKITPPCPEPISGCISSPKAPRRCATFSVAGMMDTVLNLGLNEDTAKGIAALTKDDRFALDARRRFIQMFGKTVKGIDGEKFEHALQEAKKKAGVKTDPELKPEHLRPLV